MSYVYLADFLATLHIAYVAFVFFGLVLTLLGWWRGWSWVHNRWFRGIHLLMIGGVVIRATIVDLCPISTWEYAALERAREAGVKRSHFGAVMHDLIHPDDEGNVVWGDPAARGVEQGEGIPWWVYYSVYVAFAALVLGALWLVPVNWRGRPAEAVPEPHFAGPLSPSS